MSSFNNLHRVLDRGDWNLEEIKTFLELDSSSINAVDLYGNTPLLRALKNNKCSIEVVKILLDYGSDVNYNDGLQRTPPSLLIALTFHRDADFIKLLLEKGAEINFYIFPFRSLLCYAINYYTSIDVIRLLLDAGCLSNACKKHGSALHCAIKYLYEDVLEGVLQLLIERRANVNAVDSSGHSVLCSALGMENRAKSIKVLLAAGGVLNCEIHTNPLLCAAILRRKLKTDVVQLLLEQGACLNIDFLQRALKCCNNETKAIEIMLESFPGVDIKAVEDESNNTLLHLATCNELVQKGVVKLLVKRGVEVNRVNKYGDTALHEVVKHEYFALRVVKTLLKSGSQVNVENASGETALQLAMKKPQDADAFKMLMAAGARFGVAGLSVLKGVIEECDASLEPNLKWPWALKRKLQCCKMLVKCYFLENPDLNFQYLIPRNYKFRELWRFGIDCVRELRILNSKSVGQGHTLREFLSGRSPFQVDAASIETEAENIVFDRLLRIIAENAFPLFFDIISAKVGRSSMKIKLQNLEVYTYLSSESHTGKKVVLTYDTLYKIAQLLTDDDLLRFISAFNKTGYHSSAGKVSKETIHEVKRSGEHSDQFDKHPRLHL